MLQQVGRLAREAGLIANREVQGLTSATAMAMRAIAINTFTYPRGQILENVTWVLTSMREDIIARQLGEAAAQRPAPLIEPKLEAKFELKSRKRN